MRGLENFSAEMGITIIAIIIQLWVEFKNKDRRIQEIRPLIRLLFLQIIINFFMHTPCSYYYTIMYAVIYSLIVLLGLSELIFPTDYNSDFVKRHEELKKKQKEERLKLPESQLFLKMCEMGNRFFPYIVIVVSCMIGLMIIIKRLLYE